MQTCTVSLASRALGRQILITIILPPGYDQSSESYPVLYLNDGQDFERLRMKATLETAFKENHVPRIMVVGIHANERRLHEYGTAHQADYQGRGNLAAQHTAFVTRELMDFIENSYRVKTEPADRAFAGFSLGGLSALDIAWNHDHLFSKVGVFSGSLWWRSKAYQDGYDDYNDRIMHVQIRNSPRKPNLKFWLEAGTDDEKDDRNGNGIIDAIDDTLDLMHELRIKGYQDGKDFAYVEVPGGQHNPDTWGAIMPQFLQWAFPV
ncbi:MAG: alpha/beta hydrolase-fold protein [Siphonobacter sp.]